MRILRQFFCVLFVLLSVGCTKQSSNASESSGGGQSEGPRAGNGEFTTDCGTVVNGKVQNPVSQADGILVNVEPVGTNLLIIEESGPQAQPGKQLLKLHGVAPGDAVYNSAAMDFLRNLASSSVYFYRASDDCSTMVNGQRGTIGQLITGGGKSFSEEVIRAGLAQVDVADSCGGEKIGSCLNALKSDTSYNAGELNAFLWKPVSDSNGRLAIHTGPYDTTVIVNGEKGQNAGSGNGYGSLARFSRAGCGYPSPRIQVLASDGIPYTVGGKTTFTVPNPCGRNCLSGGVISPCTK